MTLRKPGITAGIVGWFAVTLIQRATTDSTLPYLDRAGVFGDPLVVLVLVAHFMVISGAILFVSGQILLTGKTLRWTFVLPILALAIVGSVVAESLAVGLVIIGIVVGARVLVGLSSSRKDSLLVCDNWLLKNGKVVYLNSSENRTSKSLSGLLNTALPEPEQK